MLKDGEMARLGTPVQGNCNDMEIVHQRNKVLVDLKPLVPSDTNLSDGYISQQRDPQGIGLELTDICHCVVLALQVAHTREIASREYLEEGTDSPQKQLVFVVFDARVVEGRDLFRQRNQLRTAAIGTKWLFQMAGSPMHPVSMDGHINLPWCWSRYGEEGKRQEA